MYGRPQRLTIHNVRGSPHLELVLKRQVKEGVHGGRHACQQSRVRSVIDQLHKGPQKTELLTRPPGCEAAQRAGRTRECAAASGHHIRGLP